MRFILKQPNHPIAQPGTSLRGSRPRRIQNRGLTLLEALIASVILSGMVLATASALSASQQHGEFAQDQVQSALACEAKLAELLADTYENLPTYDNQNEAPGAMLTAQGDNYPEEFYRIGRSIDVNLTSIAFPELGGLVLTGYEITITAYDIDNHDVFTITHFVPQPTA